MTRPGVGKCGRVTRAKPQKRAGEGRAATGGAGAPRPDAGRKGVARVSTLVVERCCLRGGQVTISGTFKIQQWDMGRQDFLESAPGLGLFVTVTTYSEEVLLSKLYGPQGTFYFTSHSPGEHIICLESNSTQLVSFGGSRLDREENFRMTSEDTNSNVLWWAFAQTLIFISVGIFQMKYLKDFFIAKKLV
ncbi:transmembrane emp24 domain-containing protein 11 isoform X3 [Myotis myotis]|uniref:transmembrane emp24 domain-containing protein 11 isoform X3 n=1 Tax=Myotis myotis TaxID=51298 RepID=UPI001748468F|nr:transmembrane emp24 domain-containing protein 11 isoform X3 [Myotis myotis]